MTTKGLKITIYDDSGQQQIVNDIKTPPGDIVPKVPLDDKSQDIVTSIVDIKSTDYGISDFDDSKDLKTKIANAENNLNEYKEELKTVLDYLSHVDINVNELREKVNKYEYDYQQSIDRGDDLSEQIWYQRRFDNAKSEFNGITDKTKDYILKEELLLTNIKQYTEFLDDLNTYGDKKVIQSKKTVGEEESLEEINLDNIDINTAPGMAISGMVVDAVSMYLETTIQSLVASGTVNIMSKLGINQETMQIALNVLTMLDSTIMNIDSIIKFVPKNIHMVPSAKVTMGQICTSLRDMYMAILSNIEYEYNETINDAITNMPSLEEMAKDALDILLALALLIIDEQCYKYTGYTFGELYFMCSDYLAKYKAWKEARKEKRRKAKEEKSEEDSNILKVEGSVSSNKLSVEVDDEAIKSSFYNELAAASDLIYNSFMIVQIKDAIDSIRDLIQQFDNVDLNVMVDGIESLDDLINMLDELGLGDDGAVITLAEAIDQGINQFQNNLKGLLNQILNQAISAGLNMTDTLIDATDISVKREKTKIFDFTNDLNKMEMTMNIYSDPTGKAAKKSINNALSAAYDSNGKKIFDASSVLLIINTIDKGYVEEKDQELQLVLFKFKIHFAIDGFNKTALENTYDMVAKTLKQMEEQKAKEREATLHTFELGVVTEEYTADPIQATKRPTFQLVHELFSILKEIFPLLKNFLVLVNNYKVNKAKVENNSQGNIFGMVKVLAKINRLLKHTNRSNNNFYTIRSLKLFNYVNEQIIPIGNLTTVDLDEMDTRKLHMYLKTQHLNYSVIDLKLKTILYIDLDSLKDLRDEMLKNLDAASNFFGEDASLFVQYPESKYEDGTTLGLDKVEEAGDTIYYSDSSLPLYGSQIMLCFNKGYDVSI